ncbi:hypothetical protein PHYBLDRAFT_72976 [Phycomyces blakesleeanus NRRL 1555(-)]|uniref:Uncharacterized protein n=1 Tax=Phycomyces blakesleeanus (strain ATCC 8743b / DSM 1359 / FGSC 10004 / NBRC 33097 / NRRL 1555) TaxID=763407 RepID=A0A167R9A1_PHYB8|nr:hypothetical protein PHYBLDRAFT_72976 [Phycomyces blakesleeanus NRRL 1555(-)]OAD81154.1 hypothetical protein PHYBLDRAFT_72976 [Phycomyces blakesleeanus NRRL 1555(-)]|eukprot:XP_018299194.1 hypothetical protein PHYBLDRAFT_72976 [Phycomyces blakesleeanus NRRL 1555(-)]
MPKLSNKYCPTVPILDDQQHFLRQEIAELILKKTVEKQPVVCDTKEEWWSLTGIQPQEVKQTHQGTPLQDRDTAEYMQIDPPTRLSNFLGPVRRLPSYLSPQGIKEILTFSLGGSRLPVPYNSFWSIGFPMVVYQSYLSSTRMGSNLGNANQCLSQGLDYYQQLIPRINHSYQDVDEQAHFSWLDIKHKEIVTPAITTTGTFGLSFGHQEHGFQDSRYQIEGFTTINTTTDTTQIYNSSFGPQSHDADPGSHDRTLSSQTLHATLDVVQEQLREEERRVGYTTTIASDLPSGTSLVGMQYLTMERLIAPTTTKQACSVRRCEQHQMGMCTREQDNPWILVPPVDHNVYQLVGNEGGKSCPTNLPLPTALIHTCQNGQHYLNGVPEQAEWLQGLSSDDTGYQDMEAVSALWVEVDSPAYSRQGECGGGFGISLHIYKELVEAVLFSFSSYLTDMGSSFSGFICGPADPPSPNFCFMETRSEGDSNRCNVDTMVSMGQLLPEFSLEPDWTVLAQDLARGPSGDNSSTDLAE